MLWCIPYLLIDKFLPNVYSFYKMMFNDFEFNFLKISIIEE
jgi:hypothetical protein